MKRLPKPHHEAIEKAVKSLSKRWLNLDVDEIRSEAYLWYCTHQTYINNIKPSRLEGIFVNSIKRYIEGGYGVKEKKWAKLHAFTPTFDWDNEQELKTRYYGYLYNPTVEQLKKDIINANTGTAREELNKAWNKLTDIQRDYLLRWAEQGTKDARISKLKERFLLRVWQEDEVKEAKAYYE